VRARHLGDLAPAHAKLIALLAQATAR
jgi:hypothetical protein